MRKDDIISLTQNVVRKVAPHLPAIVVFAIVEYVLSRLGFKRSLVTSIAVPIILALVAEFLTQVVQDAQKVSSEPPVATGPPGH